MRMHGWTGQTESDGRPGILTCFLKIFLKYEIEFVKAVYVKMHVYVTTIDVFVAFFVTKIIFT